MMCRNPFVNEGGMAFGCGQCLPCRLNKRREWQHRIMLEAYQHEHNAFITLTYSPETEPKEVTPHEISSFIKRLRDRVSPSRFRFYAVGEYGNQSGRPHYHAGLFGFRSCVYGQSRYSKVRNRCCYWCELVRECWGKGNVFCGTVEADSAGYLAGYVIKRMTCKDDPRLNGRHPEFSRMSLRPGIGAMSTVQLVQVAERYGLFTNGGDVPTSLRHGKRLLPLGRYLRRRIRREMGLDENAPQCVYDNIAAQLLPLRLAAKADEKNPSLKKHLVESTRGQFEGMEARNRLYGGRNEKV